MPSQEQKRWSRIKPRILDFYRMKSEDSVGRGSPLTTCANPLCPLSQVQSGVAVRIKQLCASPHVADRLREIGLCEDQIIRLLTSSTNIICLVCNARLALSEQLAQTILVEPLASA